jgi:hypothetical protein
MANNSEQDLEQELRMPTQLRLNVEPVNIVNNQIGPRIQMELSFESDRSMLIFLGGSAITILAALWWFKSE